MPPRKTVSLTLGRAAQRYLLDQEVADRSPRTLAWYRQKLGQMERVFGDVRLEEIDRDRLLDFIAGLRRAGRSPAYVRGWYQVLRAFVGWAREEGYQISPTLVRDGERWFALRKPAEVEMPITTFNSEELERIEDAAAATRDAYTARRNRLLVRLLAGTGLRLSEALDLTLDDVQEDRLRVRQGKGRKSRWVPLSGRLQRDLTRWVERWRGDAVSDHLLLAREGRPLTRSAALHLFQRVAKETGLHVHAHALRHTYATSYIRRGGEIERLRRILGHTTYSQTAKYVHLAGADLARGIDELAPY